MQLLFSVNGWTETAYQCCDLYGFTRYGPMTIVVQSGHVALSFAVV
jgi:hypothetical protein